MFATESTKRLQQHWIMCVCFSVNAAHMRHRLLF